MREKLSSLHPTHKQLIKFLLVGANSTVLDWGTYYLLTRHTGFFDSHLIGAKIVSLLIASISTYTLNRFWSFQKKDKITFSELVRFYIAAAIGIGINVAITFLSIQIFHIYDLIAIVIATLVTFSWNFSINKFWVFKK